MEPYPIGNDEARPDAHVINEDRFSIIPEALLYDTAISADAVRVYAVLRRHGDDPANCYPSHARIAGLIGRAQRSINGWIRELESAGWVERQKRWTPAGDPDSNGYRVFLVQRAPGRGVRASERGGVRASERGGYAPQGAVKESQGNESQLEREEPRAPTLLSAPTFDEFWAAYPRHEDKKAARASWDRAVKTTDPEVIVSAAIRYREDPNRVPTYTKQPTTWLNRGCWENEPLPPRLAPVGNGHNGRGAGEAAVLANIARRRQQ